MHKSKPYIIGVSGGSGSGKTTFVHRLKEHFSGLEMTVFSMDDYYRPREEQSIDVNNEKNFDLPTSINRELYYTDLLRLIKGETVEKLEYNFNNHLIKSKTKVFKSANIILLEGIFVFHYKEIFDLCDLKIYISAKDGTKIIRRIKRDQQERNYPLEDVLYRYEHHVTPTYEKYILPYRNESDIIINNENGFEEAIKLVVGGLKFKLGEGI